jgi:serine/threonine protein phosphatase PrpC
MPWSKTTAIIANVGYSRAYVLRGDREDNRLR